MSLTNCEECRGVMHLLQGAGGAASKGPAKLPAILETPASSPVSAPTTTYDVLGTKLVRIRRGYEAKLPTTPEGDERTSQQGIIDGLQIAIDVLKKGGLEIDDPPPPKVRRPKQAESDGELGRTATAVLRVAARRGIPSTRLQLAVLSGYSFTSGGYDEALRELVRAGLLGKAGTEYLVTALGSSRAGGVGDMPRGDALLALWTEKLETQAANVLEAIVRMERRGEETTREAIGEATGYSDTSGGFDGALRHLRKLGLIEKRTNRPMTELVR